MERFPFVFDICYPEIKPSRVDNHITRTLSSMQNQFLDLQAFDEMLLAEDILLYEVYEIKRPEIEGELLSGFSIVHPGKVGKEYFMTKGHFHTVLETAEIYFCLKGQGYMVMENPEGDCAVEELKPNRVLYVPPRWAHRSINTGSQEDLATFFVYPANAGHNYGTIEVQGFRKLVVDNGNGPEIVDNPRWLAPGARK
ncbi:MAG TPA: glucose-6-phosphate isomerase [Anaerolineaceae bacterium]|nr:glucose-6-phosphate isomerase [Anaerolineaceae bacterium]